MGQSIFILATSAVQVRLYYIVVLGLVGLTIAAVVMSLYALFWSTNKFMERRDEKADLSEAASGGGGSLGKGTSEERGVEETRDPSRMESL